MAGLLKPLKFIGRLSDNTVAANLDLNTIAACGTWADAPIYSYVISIGGISTFGSSPFPQIAIGVASYKMYIRWVDASTRTVKKDWQEFQFVS